MDALRIPTCSEGEALFALTEVPAEEYDAKEKSAPQEMKRKPEESAPEEKEAPRERGMGKRSVPTEERSLEESAPQERGVGKRSVPTEERSPEESAPRERGVGTLASPQSVPTQAHGFSIEKDIMRTIYHMTEEEIKSIPYTSKVDIPANLNRLDHCDVSIKASCNPHMVCMADGLRFYDSVRSGNPIHMIVVHYCQIGDIKKIVTITEVDLTDSCEALFGSLTRADIETLDRAVKAVPQKKKPTEEERKTMYDIRDSLQKQSSAIHLDIKCNSTQSRLQCSFNRFQQFLETHPTRIVAKSNTHEFRGGALSPEIVSSRRVFKKTLAP